MLDVVPNSKVVGAESVKLNTLEARSSDPSHESWLSGFPKIGPGRIGGGRWDAVIEDWKSELGIWLKFTFLNPDPKIETVFSDSEFEVALGFSLSENTKFVVDPKSEAVLSDSELEGVLWFSLLESTELVEIDSKDGTIFSDTQSEGLSRVLLFERTYLVESGSKDVTVPSDTQLEVAVRFSLFETTKFIEVDPKDGTVFSAIQCEVSLRVSLSESKKIDEMSLIEYSLPGTGLPKREVGFLGSKKWSALEAEAFDDAVVTSKIN